MERPRDMLVIVLLLTYLGQSLAAVGAPCLMAGPDMGEAHRHGDGMDMSGMDMSGMDMSGMDMSGMGHRAPAGAGPDGGSCCDDGGFCSMSHCQTAVALLQANLAADPDHTGMVHVTGPLSSPTIPPAPLFRPPITR